MLPNSKLCSKAIVIKTACTGIERHADQWNILESPEINPHLNGQHLTGSKTYNGLEKVYAISGVGKIGEIHAEN